MQLIFCKDSPFFATLHPYQIWRHLTFVTIVISPSSCFCKVFRHSRQEIRPTQLHPLISNSSVTTKLQDEKQLHRLGSLTDETAKNRFSAIFSYSFPTIPRTKKMIFTKLHNKYSPSTHINKKCCYILPEVLILSFLSKSFLSFSILKMTKMTLTKMTHFPSYDGLHLIVL